MFQTIENHVSTPDRALQTLAEDLDVSYSMLRFWQEEFGIGINSVNLSALDCEELCLVAQWSKVHQFKLELVRTELERYRTCRTEKYKVVGKLTELRQFLQKIQSHL